MPSLYRDLLKTSARSCCGIVCMALILFSLTTPVAADVYNGKVASVEQVATVFRKACLGTAPGFEGFEAALKAEGFSQDDQGYWVDGTHAMSFLIWKGEGRTFCTVFYTRPIFLATPNESMMRLARTFTEIGAPIRKWIPGRYDGKEWRYFSKIARDLSFEHRYMEDVDGRHLLRAAFVVPDNPQ